MKSNRNARLNRNLTRFAEGGETWKHAGKAGAIGAGAGMIGSAIQGFSEEDDSTAQMGGGFLTGAGTGAAAGAMLGPVGAVVGGVIGGGIGLIGGKMAADKASKAKKQANLQSALSNQYIGEANQVQPAGPIFKKGGKLKKCAKGGIATANAELEKGEPYRLPNGQIEMVSNQAPSHAQGGVPLNLPDGTEILGKDKIMNSTYKKLGAQLKRTQSIADKALDSNSTTLSRSTALRNLQNTQKKWDSLFSAQQMQNTNPNGKFQYGGILDKDSIDSRNSNRAFAKGGKKGITVHESSENGIDQGYSYKIGPDSVLRQKYFYNSPDSTFEIEANGKDYEGTSYKMNRIPTVYDKQTPLPMAAKLRTAEAIKKLKATTTPQQFAKGGKLKKYEDGDKVGMGSVAPAPWDENKFKAFSTNYESLTGKKASIPDLKRVIQNRIRGGGKKGDWDTVGYWDKYNLDRSNSTPATTANAQVSLTPSSNYLTAPQTKGFTPYKANPAFANKYSMQNPYGLGTTSTKTGTTEVAPEQNYEGGWEDYAGMAAAGIPALYNMGRSIFGKADKVNANSFQNPYEAEALGVMKNRNYDIDPILSSIKESNRMADYNAKNYGGSQAEMLNRMQANSINRNRSVTDAYTQKYNTENQYKGEYAGALMNAGSNRSNMNWQAEMYNKQSQSAKDNLFGQGLGQAAQGTMDYLKYRNQKRNDQFRIKALNQGMQYYNRDEEGNLNVKPYGK